MEQALSLWPSDVDPGSRLATELQRRRLEFLVDGDHFYREGGAKDLERIAERMGELGDRAGVARAETLLGQVEIMRAEQERAVEHLSRAIALYAELPDSAGKAEALSELARLRVLQYRPEEAIAADAYLDAEDAETTEWDLQLRGRRAWLRALCQEPSGTDIERCRDSAQRYGFTRLRYNACAQGALYHACRGEDATVTALLDELVEVWRDAATKTLTAEWLSAVVHATALVPAAAPAAATVVGTLPLRT